MGCKTRTGGLRGEAAHFLRDLRGSLGSKGGLNAGDTRTFVKALALESTQYTKINGRRPEASGRRRYNAVWDGEHVEQRFSCQCRGVVDVVGSVQGRRPVILGGHIPGDGGGETRLSQLRHAQNGHKLLNSTLDYVATCHLRK